MVASSIFLVAVPATRSDRPGPTDGPAPSPSDKGIHDLRKGELMEVGVCRANLLDAVLLHERHGVQVVHRIARQPRVSCRERIQDLGVTVGLDQEIAVAAGQHRRQERPRVGQSQRMGKDLRVGGYPEEFVQDAPGEEP